MIGQRLGPYDVLAKLGEGGMGEVYRARDTTLNRDVAIKILPSGVVNDPDRLARFRREAEVLGSLNHPNIAHVYGVETSVATGPALVMEFVGGRRLDDVIGGRPMSWDDALPIARQIAEALECAHERGIVHRDLKPANIKITDAGVVKVLDFGLAKAVIPETATANPADSPTLTARATAMGVILGTAAYMAPEQAKGRPVDRRADIWAFGAVLFEMLAGRRAFGGDDITEVLASVIKTEPQWDELPADVSPAVRRLLRRCLEKDPKRRLRDIADGMLQLDEDLARPTSKTPTVAPALPWWRRALPVAAALTAGVALTSAYWLWKPRPSTTRGPLQQFRVTPQGMSTIGARNDMAVSRDGRYLVYYGRTDRGSQLLLRRMDQGDHSVLRDTENAFNPFVSPDGEWVGFVDAVMQRQLFKVSVHGGPRLPITTDIKTRIVGADWVGDDVVFGTSSGLWRASASGGQPVQVTRANTQGGELGHSYPSIVPGAAAVVFSIGRSGTIEDSVVAAASLESGVVTPLNLAGTSPRYLRSGHIAYLTSDGTIWVVGFNPRRMELMGAPAPLARGVLVKINGSPNFDVTDAGTLVYVQGTGLSFEQRELVWFDPRTGKETAIGATPQAYRNPRLSPDDANIALELADRRNSAVWIWDVKLRQLRKLTTEDTNASHPVWSADSSYIIYTVTTVGKDTREIYRRRADGTGHPERLYAQAGALLASYALTPDGNTLLFRIGPRLATLVIGQPVPRPLGQGEGMPSLSADGKLLAYQSIDSGTSEVRVTPFPEFDRERRQVSTGGGSNPLWSRTADELFYVSSDRRQVMRATVQRTPKLASQAPVVVFDVSAYLTVRADIQGRNYDIARDGRFLMLKQPDGDKSADQRSPEVTFILNWLEEAKARVTAKSPALAGSR